VVRNRDRAAGSQVDGFGISGMRRRVTHLGGRLHAGEADGMFEVRATIPTEPE
jgi:signal transduction histidine kinase